MESPLGKAIGTCYHCGNPLIVALHSYRDKGIKVPAILCKECGCIWDMVGISCACSMAFEEYQKVEQ